MNKKMASFFNPLVVVACLLLALYLANNAHSETKYVYDFEASYVSMPQNLMIREADAVFIGRVLSISPAKWNQDTGEYWREKGEVSFPYHTIEVQTLQSLADTTGLGQQVTLTVLGGSPAGSVQSGEILISNEADHTLEVGQQALFFVVQSEIAWRSQAPGQPKSRQAIRLISAPWESYLTLGSDGLYHSSNPEEPPLSLDQIILKVQQLRQSK